MHKKNALKEVKMPLGVSPLTELRVFIDWILRPYSTAQKEEKLLKNKPFRFSHIVRKLSTNMWTWELSFVAFRRSVLCIYWTQEVSIELLCLYWTTQEKNSTLRISWLELESTLGLSVTTWIQ